MPSSPSRRIGPVRPRSFGLSTALWLFGLFTSVLLIGLWGRSVAGDQVTLEAGTRAVLESEIVNDRLADWVGDAVAAAGEYSPEEVAAVVAAVQGTEEMDAAIGDVVDQVVTAALAPPGAVAELDLTAVVDGLLPVVASAIEAQGIAADGARIAALNAPSIVLSADDQTLVGQTAREVRGLLSRVVVVGLAGMGMAGLGAVVLSDNRLRQIRALAVRIAVSAVTFAIIIRTGAWAVDPAGGRSPIAAGGAVMLRSNGSVLAAVALGATIAVVAISIVLVRRRPVSFPVDEPEDDSTTEIPVPVPAGI